MISSYTQIRVGGVPEHFNLPWHLAIENQKFENQKITLQWQDFPDGTGAMCKALRHQEIDIAVILTEGIITDIANGNPSKILQYYVLSPLLWGIHVPADSSYQKIEDLEGKIHAISRLGSGSHLMAYVNAHQQNWNLTDLKFEIINNLIGARKALKNHQADAFLWEKYTTQPFVDNGEFRRVGVCPTPWACFVLAVRNDVLEEKPEAIKAVQQVINQSCAEITQIPNLVEVISQRYQLKPKNVVEWLKLTQWEIQPNLDPKSLEDVTNYLKMLDLIQDDFAIENLLIK